MDKTLEGVQSCYERLDSSGKSDTARFSIGSAYKIVWQDVCGMGSKLLLEHWLSDDDARGRVCGLGEDQIMSTFKEHASVVRAFLALQAGLSDTSPTGIALAGLLPGESTTRHCVDLPGT